MLILPVSLLLQPFIQLPVPIRVNRLFSKDGNCYTEPNPSLLDVDLDVGSLLGADLQLLGKEVRCGPSQQERRYTEGSSNTNSQKGCRMAAHALSC
eukprot:scaffold104187_cov43-Tisochrysis_lutea.AAC.1